MKKIVLLLLAMLSPLTAREINGDGDFQWWMHEEVDKPIGKKMGLLFRAEQRWAGDSSTLYFQYLQGNVRLDLTDWLEFAPGYRQSFILNNQIRKWHKTYAPMFFLILHKDWKGWEASLRHQVQYLIFQENRPNEWLFRFRPMLFFPIEFGKIKAKPYLFDELFFTDRVGFFENRAGGGLRFPFFESFIGQIEYIYRSLWNGQRWLNQSVIRIYARFPLKP